MTQPVRNTRKKKLIHPRLQLKLIGTFGGVALLAMLLQFLLLGYQMTRVASSIEGVGGQLASQVPKALLVVLGFSLVVLVPLFVALGILLTHRIAGPAYRFEQYMRGIARGEENGLCKIRDGDELQSLCDAINEAVTVLRSKAEPSTETDLTAA